MESAKSKKVKSYYMYEHINGTLHKKNFMIVEMGGGPYDYFNSPFVKSWKLVSEVVDA